MAQSMATIPKPVYYKFDAVRGRLCEPSGMYWAAFNPDYDPGPPAQEIVRKGVELKMRGSPVLLDTPPKTLSSNLSTTSAFVGSIKREFFRESSVFLRLNWVLAG